MIWTEKITFVSPSVKTFIGYDQYQIVGKNLRDLIFRDDLEKLWENIQKIHTGEEQSNEYRIITKSNEIRWIITSSRPVVEKGKITGTQGILTDITDRKRIEETTAWEARVNAIIAELSKSLISEESIAAISETILMYAQKLTGSRSGYTGYLDSKTGTLLCPAISLAPGTTATDQTDSIDFNRLWNWIQIHRTALRCTDNR